MLENIKSIYGNLQLKKEANRLERVRKNPDLQAAGTIGILYDATTKEIFDLVKEFYLDLKQHQKNPVSLGYIDFNEALHFHPLARPEADYFFKNQQNWFKKPNGAVVENFIDEPFDILINLTLEDNYAIDYIASVSKAGLKIGRAESAVAFSYDMTFFLDKDANLRSFAYMIIHYLSNINNEKQKSTQRNRSSHYYTI
jgi:hypothetical protein